MPRIWRGGEPAPDRWDASRNFEREIRLARQAERSAAAASVEDVQQPAQPPLAVALAAAGQVIANPPPVLNANAVNDNGTEIASQQFYSNDIDVAEAAAANGDAASARVAAAAASQAAAAAASAAVATSAAHVIRPVARPTPIGSSRFFGGNGGSGRGVGGKGLGKGGAKRHKKIIRDVSSSMIRS